MSLKHFILLGLLMGTLTYVLYTHRASQPPDQERIEYCNELVSQMPEGTEPEINRNINTFLDCLGE